jgi:hypothetical protein
MEIQIIVLIYMLIVNLTEVLFSQRSSAKNKVSFIHFAFSVDG